MIEPESVRRALKVKTCAATGKRNSFRHIDSDRMLIDMHERDGKLWKFKWGKKRIEGSSKNVGFLEDARLE
jgi:hypothetical protein